MNQTGVVTAEDFNDFLTKQRIFSTAFSVLLLLIGIFGNITVIFMYNFRIKKREVRYFLPILAVTDLCACIIGSTFVIIQNTRGATFPNYRLCKYLYYMTFTFSTCSATLLFVIAVERYRKVCTPIGRQMTLFWKRIALALSIGFSILLPMPLFRFVEEGDTVYLYRGANITIMTCSLKQFGMELQYLEPIRATYFVILNILTIANMVITVALYIPIGRKIFIAFRSIKRTRDKSVHEVPQATTSSGHMELEEEGSYSDTTEHTMNKTESVTKLENPKPLKHVGANTRRKIVLNRKIRNNFSIMFMTIVGVYVISYMPTEIFLILGLKPTYWYQLDSVTVNMLLCLERMFLFNHIVNPFLYGFFDLTFRKQLKDIICRCRRGRLTTV